MSRNIFNQDVIDSGAYLYNTEQLSCQLANARINKGIHGILDISGKTFFDIGCGDGVTAEVLYSYGAASVIGVDPAEDAVAAANQRINILLSKCDSLVEITRFFVGDIYDYTPPVKQEVILFSRVLHHLADPAKAIATASTFGDGMLIIEPNGNNPIVKLIEMTSTYHREHGEKSFTSCQLKSWIEEAGFVIIRQSYVNLVPMFCPDWMAKICRFFEPLVERIPLIRALCCGQIIIVAQKKIL